MFVGHVTKSFADAVSRCNLCKAAAHKKYLSDCVLFEKIGDLIRFLQKILSVDDPEKCTLNYWSRHVPARFETGRDLLWRNFSCSRFYILYTVLNRGQFCKEISKIQPIRQTRSSRPVNILAFSHAPSNFYSNLSASHLSKFAWIIAISSRNFYFCPNKSVTKVIRNRNAGNGMIGAQIIIWTTRFAPRSLAVLCFHCSFIRRLQRILFHEQFRDGKESRKKAKEQDEKGILPPTHCILRRFFLCPPLV